ncbi:MAG: Rrf2 family transcriptional regulator [bacterium]
MKMSTKGRYALRLMADLAKSYTGDRKDYVKLKDISLRQDISKDYLVSLLQMLKNANLVRSSRGKEGGYILARPPEKINALEVVESTIGTISIVGCLEDKSLCDRTRSCGTRKVWNRLNNTIKKELSEITLDQIN